MIVPVKQNTWIESNLRVIDIIVLDYLYVWLWLISLDWKHILNNLQGFIKGGHIATNSPSLAITIEYTRSV